jgi:hypothetical protein
MKPNTPNTNWLPSPDEWDFRSVAQRECRFACLWEYMRSVPQIVSGITGWAAGKALAPMSVLQIIVNGIDSPALLKKSWMEIYRNISHVMFSPDDFKYPSMFINELAESANPVSKFLWRQFSNATRRGLHTHECGVDNTEYARTALVERLNTVLNGSSIYHERRFADVKLAEETRRRAQQESGGEDLIRLNRMLLEEAFPRDIRRNFQLLLRDVMDWDYWLASPIRIRSLASLKQKLLDRISAGRDPAVFVGLLRDSDYVVTVNFLRAGTERITSALESWARKEAKKFPRAPQARAAEPPYDCLKWLAANRLEEARQRAGVGFDDVKDALKKHRSKNPAPNSFPTLPIYASHGAWSKAKGDAKRLLDLLESNPKAFEKKLLF